MDSNTKLSVAMQIYSRARVITAAQKLKLTSAFTQGVSVSNQSIKKPI